MARKTSSNEVIIMDVAKEAGVSFSTGSCVVNNKGYVKEETQKKLLQAMTHLGCQANLQARSLADGCSNVIGLLVVDLTPQYMEEIMRGIDDVLSTNQYEHMLYTTHRRKTKESASVLSTELILRKTTAPSCSQKAGITPVFLFASFCKRLHIFVKILSKLRR